jgi:hypothetical protein
MEVYRACSYLELETLLITGGVKGFHDNTGAISCTLDYSFARRLITNAMFVFLNANSNENEVVQQVLVTFDFDKLNNPIEVQYDMDWFENNEIIRDHVFGLGFDEDNISDDWGDEDDYDHEKKSFYDSIAQEQEVIIFNHKMTDGMILKIQSSNQDILDKLSRLYDELGYTEFVEFSQFI